MLRNMGAEVVVSRRSPPLSSHAATRPSLLLSEPTPAASVPSSNGARPEQSICLSIRSCAARFACGRKPGRQNVTMNTQQLTDQDQRVTGKMVAETEAQAIRPFRVDIPETALADLRRRLAQTRLPETETVSDFSQGVPLKTVKQLLSYWQNAYDWRKVEARLNAVPNFITEIDGLDIHFIHVRSKHEDALPLIVTHGWPGSVVEQLKIIAPLTDPTAHGGRASDAFHLVIPSMPGYGFSGKPTTTGWGPERIAQAWSTLMRRLGYKHFVAQGGDWGALITDQLGVQAPPELLGIHSNMPGAIPAEINELSFAGAPTPPGLSAEESSSYEQLVFFYKHAHYAFWMATRPQTLTAFADSPIGLATFLLDHDARSLELIARSFDGQTEGLTPDDVLDNVTLFWLTNTGVSSARLYWENRFAFVTPKGVKVPTAVSVFPDELYETPRTWAEQAYPKLIHYNKLEKGGHFRCLGTAEAVCRGAARGLPFASELIEWRAGDARSSARRQLCAARKSEQKMVLRLYAVVGSNRLEQARIFYDALLGSAGIEPLLDHPSGGRYYGKGGVLFFGVLGTYDGQPATVGNGSMVSFVFDSRAEVDAFQQKALELGAKDEGAPGYRAPTYYMCYFRDLDGNKLCAAAIG